MKTRRFPSFDLCERSDASASAPAMLDVLRAKSTRWMRSAVHGLSSPRSWFLGMVHVVVFAAAYWLSYCLRCDFALPAQELHRFWASVVWVIAVEYAVFAFLGQFHGWWRYVTFADLVALVRASLTTMVVLATINFLGGEPLMPRSVPIINCMLVIVMLGAMRASWRAVREVFQPMLNGSDCRWALMVGTDLSSGILAHQIQSHSRMPYRLRGLLTTNGDLANTYMGQIPILGRIEDVAEIAAASRATDVLVVAGTLPGPRMRGLMEACQTAGLNLKIIRSFEDRVLAGNNQVPTRDIEINDLLRRDPVTLDTKNIGQLLEGRRVLVTGAGGSIGSEICRQIMAFHPESLTLVGRGENRIFAIERELRSLHSSTVLRPCIADVTNRDRLEQVFQAHRPEVVFHAAAHKHVPLMEANVGEAVRNNVLGTKCVADLADRYGVQSFVLISTDKAVHPTSVMGTTKHIAERYVHTLSQESATKFTVVRFGNVLGSAGSVVPIFKEQIRQGGPITITDPRMTRFFMTIPEASQLVLQAATMGAGGEIFVLEMGEPVRIVDLARDMIRLSGLPENAIEISFTGIRPGEKLYEELYFDDEQTLPTSHPKLRAAYHRPYSLAEVRRAIAQLERLVNEPEEVIRRKLREIVPDFNPPFDAGERPEAPVLLDARAAIKASA
ncbi:MAG: nucleoside-diphosphate sugar epimerase/dehydratase [Thermoguttaceae bacterium]